MVCMTLRWSKSDSNSRSHLRGTHNYSQRGRAEARSEGVAVAKLRIRAFAVYFNLICSPAASRGGQPTLLLCDNDNFYIDNHHFFRYLERTIG
jgi:hypothetical protein